MPPIVKSLLTLDGAARARLSLSAFLERSQMPPEELQWRLKFHEEQANRLLQAHPMVAEFFHHLTQVELLKQQLQAASTKGESQ